MLRMLLCCLGLLLAAPAWASESPLAELPSAPGPHVAKLKALSAGGWLSLGQAAADPKYGTARGRSYTPRMAYAPKLLGAFYTGEGNHGWFDKETGVYQDDVWFYDINAHRWICVKPGTNGKTVEMKLNEDGFEVDADGNLLPVAFAGHGYEHLTYDSDRNRFVFVTGAVNTYWKACMGKRRLEWLKDERRPLGWAQHPWQYDVASGKWLRSISSGGKPKIGRSTTAVHYIPEKKKVFVSATPGQDFYYDPGTNTWEPIDTQGTRRVPGYPVTCYDSKRQRIWVLGMKAKPNLAMWYFEVATGQWHEAKVDGAQLTHKVPYVTGGFALAHDSTNDVILLRHGGHYRIFEPATGKLHEPLAPPQEFHRKHVCTTIFYSPDHNAFFIYRAGDSVANGDFWAYRHE